MNEPILSFIIPVYNTGEYLKECVDSVQAQSCPLWEAVLIDDGSTDGSGLLCDEFAKSDSRIRVIHKSNTGQFDSRMHGIKMARGLYCTGLDSDDYVEKNLVERMKTVTDNAFYDIVCWNMREVLNGTEISTDSLERYGEYTNVDFLKTVRKSTNHSFCNKLIRTELLINSDFPEIPYGARHSEDMILICPAICMAQKIIALDEVFYNYRQINDSVTHGYTGKRILDYLDSEICIRKIIGNYGMNSPELEKVGAAALIRSVGYCLKQAYRTSCMQPEISERIRKHEIYLQLKEYESKDYLPADLFFIMKLFRLKFDWLLKIRYENR